MNLRALLSVASLMLASVATAQAPYVVQERFEKKVSEYEAADKNTPPPRHAILFAGDSQFYRWKTIHEDLPEYTLVNRGVDSFQLPDLIHYADRLVIPYEPRLIVLHVGGNDVHNGRTPTQVLADIQTFVALVRKKLPKVRIVYSSVTPSPGRWDEAPQRREANRIVRDYVAGHRDLGFIDLWDAMLTADGQPREDLWVEDRVHPNHAGYVLRVKLTRPFLGKPDPPAH